ncbi:MAG TPA: PAS domain S-box protein [Syntrophales bacterium]|jgi:PAS domain S-box-containing protein|nr:PAS domain S-box protein [Syntrophales bacterium]HON23541.1 PAS domain S-box protein [Syntrophales bacterium]HOU78138.1 PAS domain S-box protein [Syntrophales bacterium]HPC33297.1 PAS domain S-box protein [Syntrophales bacterium]HQG33401.1 PAS domain S-box protein [Syntrophales bacterium]
MDEKKMTKRQQPAEPAALHSRRSALTDGKVEPPPASSGGPAFDRETYAGIFASFPAGVTVTNKNGVVVYVNPAFVRITGYDLPDLPTDKQWFHKAFPDRERRREALSVWVRYQTGGVQKQKIFSVACKNGRIKSLEISLALTADEGLIALFAEKDPVADAARLPGEGEDKWRLLLDIMNEGFINVDEKGVPVFVNQRLCDMLGYTGEEVVGRPLTVFLAEESRGIFQEEFAQRIRGESRSYEITARHKSGERRYFIISPRPLYDSSGRFAGSYATCTDITDRKLIEETLRRSEERYRRLADDYRSIVENASEGVYRSVPAGHYLMANHAFARMLGYDSPAELLSAVSDIEKQLYVPPETREENLRRVVAAGGGEFESRVRHRDGGIRWLDESVRVVRDEKGEVSCFEGIVKDITDRKAAELALEASERKYRTLFNNSAVGIIVTDLSGRIREANPAWQRLTGYAEEEYRQLTPEVHYANQQDRLAVRAALADTGMIRNYEMNILSRNKAPITVLLSSDLIALEGETVILSQVMDITDRKQTEEALRQSEEKYRHIFDNSTLGIYQVTPGGRFISANDAAARNLGYENAGELMAAVTDVGTQLYAFPEDRARALAIMKKEGVLKDFEVRCRHKNGGLVWLSFNAKPVRDRWGKVLYHDGTSQDIDRRKRVEEELRDCRQRYEELLAGVREIAWETDADGRLVYVSPAVKQVLGYRPEEIQGRMPWEFLQADDEDKLRALISRFLANPAPLIIPEGKAVHKQGRLVPFAGSGYPCYDRQGGFRGYRGVLRDISPRRDQLIFDIGAKSPTPPRRPADKAARPRRP